MAYEPFVGEICIYGFNFAPDGWATCGGQQIQVQQNQALYSLIGVTFGGNGTQYFNLPNLLSRVPIGGVPQATNIGGLTARVIGTTGGTENVTLNSSQTPLAAHSHTATFTPGSGSTANVAIPAASSAGTTNVAGTTAVLSNGNTADRAPLPINIYGTAANTTLKPFPVSVPAGTGTVAVNNNTPTPAASAVPLMNPFLALNFCIALQGIYPQRP